MKYFGIDVEKERIVVESIQKLSRILGHTDNIKSKDNKSHTDNTDSTDFSSTRIATNGHEFSINPSLVIIDEAHHALAKTYRMLWDRWPKAKFLGLKMYGNLEWVGASLLKGQDVNGEELYWDRRYNQYYHEKPEFVRIGGIEMTKLKVGYVLRKHPTLIKPTSKRKIYYNNNIIWMDDWLISKNDS